MIWIYENLMSIFALTIAIVAFISTQRGLSQRARADAVRQVEGKIVQLNEKLEAEVVKLQEGLDRCIKERVKFKEDISSLKKSLKLEKANDREKEADTNFTGD